MTQFCTVDRLSRLNEPATYTATFPCVHLSSYPLSLLPASPTTGGDRALSHTASDGVWTSGPWARLLGRARMLQLAARTRSTTCVCMLCAVHVLLLTYTQDQECAFSPVHPFARLRGWSLELCVTQQNPTPSPPWTSYARANGGVQPPRRAWRRRTWPFPCGCYVCGQRSRTCARSGATHRTAGRRAGWARRGVRPCSFPRPRPCTRPRGVSTHVAPVQRHRNGQVGAGGACRPL